VRSHSCGPGGAPPSAGPGSPGPTGVASPGAVKPTSQNVPASADTSGTTRRGAPVPRAVASEPGTTPRWYAGWAIFSLTPPPEPIRKVPGGGAAYPEPVIAVTVSPQAYSATGLPVAPMARLVPPTPVAQASEVGNGTLAWPVLSSLPSP
jgi:hypothetical protein